MMARFGLVCFLVCAALISQTAAASAQIKATITGVTEDDGYARLVLTFPHLPEYEVSVVSGVLVVEFEEPVSTNLAHRAVNSPEFIIIGRADPDGKTLRFALAQTIRVNTMEAGEQLFIDLVPLNWRGMLPGLPPDVVAKLAQRAEDAEKAAELEARRKALENSKYKLRIHVGQQPTFSRIVFDWGARVGAKMSRSGDRVVVAFDQLAKPPMERLKVDPPRYVKSARATFDNTGLQIELNINSDSDVRGFREENTYVVDISAPHGTVNTGNEPVTSLTGDETVVSKPPLELIELKRETHLPGGTPPDEPVSVDPEMPQPVEAPVTMTESEPLEPAVSVVEPRTDPAAVAEVNPTEESDQEPIPSVIISEFYLNSDGTDLASTDMAQNEATPAAPQPAADNVPAPAVSDPPIAANEIPAFNTAMKATAAAPQTVSEPTAIQSSPEEDPTKPIKISAERTGSVLRVKFPFAKPTAASVFRRSDVLWLVFDSGRVLDLSAVEQLQDRHFSDVAVMRTGSTQVVRFHLSGVALASTSAEQNAWVLSLADMYVTPTAPVSLKRGLRADGRSKLSIQFARASSIHRIKDPEVGDQLIVVTGFGPQRGMVKPQGFVEFSMLKTSHGLAVQPLTDDIRVRLLEEEVLITRSGGLTLSSSRLSELNDATSGFTDGARPGFIDYKRWSPEGPGGYVRRTHLLESAITDLDPSQSGGPRLDLARLHLANGLGSEALGQLNLIAESDPELRSEPMFAALHGIALVLMHRPKEARKNLSNFGLKNDPYSALWRGILASQERKWNEAVNSFRDGEHVINEYPPLEQMRFRVAAMRAAVEINDFATADLHFKLMPKTDLPESMRAEVLVLEGRLLDGLGRSIEAFDVLAEAVKSDDLKAEAEALYHYALLGHRLEKFNDAELQARLETLAAIWRGDDLELNTLRRLAVSYIAKKDYRAGLRTMKIAVVNHPKAELSVEIHNDMTALFEELYLRGNADKLKPVEALALYYEYRELTPVGRRGDEMIRKLADRLISVDLLDQAVEILDHQVDKRLIGAARAQVAAKLAMVHLMNRKPDMALQAIRRTRQAVLPQHIQLQRRLIEARALSELKHTDAAVDLLANVDGEQAHRQRAEAYWHGQRWQNSGELFERLLGNAGQQEEALSTQQRVDVLRAAISYVLSDDKIGLDRLRSRFEAKMAKTPDESAFKVVTRSINRDSISFRNLAKEIASIDTLETFLLEFRKTFEEPAVGANVLPQQ